MGQFKRHFICFTLLVSVYKHFWNYHWSNSGTDTFLQFNSKQAAARCLLNNICALKSRAHMIRIDIHRIDQVQRNGHEKRVKSRIED
ncbi:PREDICTED: uncharacterized protein LOC109116911 isoform X5 [Tarenaya hassleriana]|uniref:uncharacterized protein LOC109116911 isoform X5 n=1 Tax=Tarenaya hassleriana TaxID=28532 RepID=UPI0008FD6580|nr:PREDICTED: uncharacterized protein LOC109116911 isoform X5 [Tarenaya hassleriana]